MFSLCEYNTWSGTDTGTDDDTGLLFEKKKRKDLLL